MCTFKLPTFRATIFIVIHLLVGSSLHACTFFKITKDGKTIVGNNEDAWSINAQVWFRTGRTGEYGGVYFAHYNGSPIRSMMDQGGMNTAGLVFDALLVENRAFAQLPNTTYTDLDTAIQKVMSTCATVYEAEAILKNFTFARLDHAMLVLVNRNGDHLVAEGDTLYTGNDASFALGNFRMSRCVDLDAVPIERYQNGRALIATNPDASLATARAILDKMAARRGSHEDRRGVTGTLYSNVYEPLTGRVHLYFYHDHSTVRSFNLQEELAKGDHVLDMASLFPTNADYQKLVAYKTPIHQRWLFYGMIAVAAFFAITLLYCCLALLKRSVARWQRRSASGSWAFLLLLLVSLLFLSLIPFLLIKEGAYFFGLGYATDSTSLALKYIPIVICLLLVPIAIHTFRGWRSKPKMRQQVFFTLGSVLTLLMIGLFIYWDMIFV